MKLSFLGALIALVAAFGLIAAGNATQVNAQAAATKTCTQPTGGFVAGATFTCTESLGLGGSSATLTLTGGATNFNITAVSATGAAGTCAPASIITSTSSASVACSVTLPGNFFTGVTETLTIPTGATNGTVLTQSVLCTPSNPTAGAPGSCGSGTASTVTATAISTTTGAPVTVGAGVPAPAPSPVGTLTASNISKTCSPTPAANTPMPTTSSPFVTTCKLVITAPSGTAFPTTTSGAVVASDTITSSNAVFSNTGSTSSPSTPLQPYGNVVPCAEGNGGMVSGSTLTCTLPPITITGATSLTESVTVESTSASGAVTAQTINGVSPAAGTFSFVTAGNAPISATLTCGSGSAFSAGTSTAGFTLPLTGSATNCVITPKGINGTSPVADGTFVVSIVQPGAPALLTCGTSGCTSQNSGMTLNIACGSTAPSGSTPNVSCTSANFNIQSTLAAALSNPAGGVTPVFSSAGGTVQVQITFLATPGNGGSAGGGINLGDFTIGLGTVGTGVLVVSASPALIPSNGTTASLVQATFAGSSTNALNSLVTSGAFLPGTFTFTSSGPVIFDNGRETEVVPCGVSANVSSFGVGSTGASNFNQISPVLFTCTGAAALAIGNGSAGDAPISVTYQSSVGDFSAVGATLVTVIASGSPKISVGCANSSGPITASNPIHAGGPGAVCVATVTDQNNLPLSGLTGAGVTFTTSNPSITTVLACQISASVTTGIGFTPTCTTPTAQIPASGTTFLNGQAAALVVASNSTGTVAAISSGTPTPVTITASLGVFVPPSFACLVAPNSAAVGTTANVGCGSANALGTSGLATALNASSLGLNGLIALPNATSASTTIYVVSGSFTVTVTGSPMTLTRGCNQVVVNTTAGTAVSKIAAAVSPASAVVSIWRFNNTTKTFQAGYFSDASAPTDFSTTAGGSEVYFICVSGAATVTSA